MVRVPDSSAARGRGSGLDSAISHLREIPHLRAAFIKEQREKKEKSDAGRRKKRAQGIMHVVRDLVRENPKVTAQEALFLQVIFRYCYCTFLRPTTRD